MKNPCLSLFSEGHGSRYYLDKSDGCCFRDYSPMRYLSIAFAVSRPAAMQRTTSEAPVFTSPAANTLSTLVACVVAAVFTFPRASFSSPRSLIIPSATGLVKPMARSTSSALMVDFFRCASDSCGLWQDLSPTPLLQPLPL